MRIITAARVLAGLVAASTFLGPTAPRAAQAQTTTTPTLAGLQGRALASGVAVAYKPENLLPIASPIDLSSPDALATIASGPSTFARASVADPGDLLANPDALLSLASADYQSGTIPPYPFRVAASSGVGEPAAESNPAPGLNARVAADTKGSTARASMPGLSAPAVATAGSITSTATTTTDGGTVTVRARTEVSTFNLLNVLTIDSLVTDVSATSDGEKTELKGGTTITGAAVQGQAVVIDSNGVQAGVKSLNDALAAAGIHVTLAGPEPQGDGKSVGQMTAAGLRILLDTAPSQPVLGQIPALVPPLDVPGIEDAIALTQVRHLQYIDVGRGFVSLAARGKFAAPPESIDLGSDIAPSPAVVGAAGLVGDTPPIASTPLPRSTSAPQPLRAPEPASATTLASGIGALALLALLAQPFFGSRLARFANTLLAPGAAGTCPQENR